MGRGHAFRENETNTQIERFDLPIYLHRNELLILHCAKNGAHLRPSRLGVSGAAAGAKVGSLLWSRAHVVYRRESTRLACLVDNCALIWCSGALDRRVSDDSED